MRHSNSNSKDASNVMHLDCMSEPEMPDYSGVYLGKSFIYKIPVFLNLDLMMNKNMAIIGMSGAGKSYMLKSFIAKSSIQRGSAVLIIDWNNEYGELVRHMDGAVLSLGKDITVNVLDLHDLHSPKNVRKITEMIGAMLKLSPEEEYSLYSGMLSISEDFSHMNIRTLIKCMENPKDDTSSKVAKKLLQLVGNPMFADRTNFTMADAMRGIVSLDFSALKDDFQRGEISGMMLKAIIEFMHASGIAQNGIERIIVLDEAWRLIQNSNDVNVLFREGRKYGFCVAVATQLASDINNEVISNSACVFIFRLQNESDYKILEDSGVITEGDKREIMKLQTGSCLVSFAGINSTNSGKLILSRIDGIDIRTCSVIGGKMKNVIPRRAFEQSLNELDAGEVQKTQVIGFLSENNNEVDDTALIMLMMRLSIKRYEIICFLRRLGLKDARIVKAYETAAVKLGGIVERI